MKPDNNTLFDRMREASERGAVQPPGQLWLQIDERLRDNPACTSHTKAMHRTRIVTIFSAVAVALGLLILAGSHYIFPATSVPGNSDSDIFAVRGYAEGQLHLDAADNRGFFVQAGTYRDVQIPDGAPDSAPMLRACNPC